MMQKEEQEERKSIIKSYTLKWDFKHMIDLKSYSVILRKETCKEIQRCWSDQITFTKPKRIKPIQIILLMQEMKQKQAQTKKWRFRLNHAKCK